MCLWISRPFLRRALSGTATSMGVLIRSALQTLHRASWRAREHNHFAGGASHAWAEYYERHVHSDRSCLNEWNAMDCLESRRPPSPDSLRHKPCEREETEKVIRCTLKEIMMTVDLDEVTSKVIRGRLEEDLDMDLGEFKSFIDEEMLTILGQMDAPTEIFDHVYLGSEWNASNLEELQRNGVRHILNVTREIDNFFPGMFDYLNIRVYDDEKTDLLKHWDNTFKYITKARNEGSKVLVHCKMGVSRSASVVIAYAMKAYNWNFDKALKHVKGKRNCIKPNNNFLIQLETYQGILDAMKNKEKLQRSKSETNLKSPSLNGKNDSKSSERARLLATLPSWCGGRPRSWSPDTKLAAELLPPTSVSLENLAAAETRHMLMPCANGTYSVSPNQIMRLKEEGATSVKHIVLELESAAAVEKKHSKRPHFRLSFNSHTDQNTYRDKVNESRQSKQQLQKDKTHTWDPGEDNSPKQDNLITSESEIVKCDSGIADVRESDSSTRLTRAAEFEKRLGEDIAPPSRQSSWSSVDSAVGLDLSRNSSWGSYDTRGLKNQMQSGRDDISTLKKSKHRQEDSSTRDEIRLNENSNASQQKISTDLCIISEKIEPRVLKSSSVKIRCNISDNERKFNETCAILKELTYGRGRSEPSVCWSRLSASAPTDSWLRRSGPRLRPASASYGDLPSSTARSARQHSGIVENLKKEFEARSSTHSGRETEPCDQEVESLRKNSKSKSHSLAQIVENKTSITVSQKTAEDLSVKVLVDKYDSHLCRSKCPVTCDSKRGKLVDQPARKRNQDGEGSTRASAPLRNSFCGVTRGSSSAERPPIAPNVVSIAPANYYPNLVMASVMSKAQTKKQLQHGKTHPLTRLNLNRSSNRCSNAVYNTM